MAAGLAIRLKPRGRSPVTNGRKLFVEADGRSVYARRFKDLYALHADDLGGEDVLSEAQRSMLRRVVSLEIELERMESTLANGGQVDVDLYSRVANTTRRLLESLGTRRVVKTVEPTLSDILAQHADEKPARGARKAAREPVLIEATVAAVDIEEELSAAPGSIGEAAE